mgnify:CR=1 FL=1
MDGALYGYRRMQKIVNNTDVTGLADLLSKYLRGNVAEGMIACLREAETKRTGTEILHRRMGLI